MKHAQRAAAGFTLIEVLVALVIVAFGIGALMSTLTSAAESIVVMRDRTFAQWIALNRVSELRLRSGTPPTGETTGEIDYANDHWVWTAKVQDTGLADLTRIDVDVGRKPSGTGKMQPLATASGFASKAVAPRTGATPDWSGVEFQAKLGAERNLKAQSPSPENPITPTPPPAPPPISDPSARQ